MSNILVVLCLCAILKAIDPSLSPASMYVTIFVSAVVDGFRLADWVNDWRSK